MHWVEFWLHAGCRLGLLGLLGMLLLVPCAPLVAWIHFGEHFGSELVAQRLDFKGPGLNFGAIFNVF